MTEAEVMFNKVYNEDKTRLFRIKTEWENNFFRLTVAEGTTSWFALVTKKHIDMLANQHEIDANIYYQNVREYICHDQSSVSFDVAKKQFFIFRTLEKNFRIKYFFINLEKLIYQEAMEGLVDEVWAKYTNTLKKLQILEEQKLEADSQKLLFEKKCEQFTELKRKSDLQMYSAFLLVLNEKKHRIRFLTELLDEYKGGRKRKINETTEDSRVLKNKGNPRAQIVEETKTPAVQREELSDSDPNHSDGYNTDDEKQAKAIDKDIAIPGTSKDNFDFLGGDSPPPSLPKRLKKDSSSKCIASNSVNNTTVAKVEVKQQTVMENEDSDEESQSAGFDTQELLDRM